MGIRSLSTASISTGTKRSKIWDQSAVVITNSFESIATYTIGSTSQASVSFTSIPSTYKHLQIRWMGQHTGSVTNTSLAVQLNSDTGSNYAQHRAYSDGSGVSGIAATSQTFIRSDRMNSPASASSIFGVGIIDILDYANANKYKTIRSIGGVDNNGSGFIGLDSGNWANSAAITSITLLAADSGNLAQYSRFALYGIRG